MTECKDAAEDEVCTMACSSVQEPQSVLKVCRLQCNNTVKVLLEATRNSPDLVPKQIIDYLIMRTTDVRHQMPWCTTNEMANYMATQLRERFCTGQLWTMRKVHLLLHQLLWRGSSGVVTQMCSEDDELIDAGQMIERVLRTRQEHASSVRIVAAMERACALHTPPYPSPHADKGGSSSSSSSSKDDDYAVAYGTSMLAHMRNHIGYLAALYKYRIAYSDMVDLPEMRIIHYKLKRPLSFCDVSRALRDTLDLLRRTAADDVRAGSFCAFGLAIVHGRVDVDARALYNIAVDLLTKLLVQLYEKARLICLKHRMQLADKKTATPSPVAAAATAAATGDGHDGQRDSTSDKSSSTSYNDDNNNNNNDHGNASGDGVSVQVLRRELYVLLCKWRDIVDDFNDTIGALARFCADVQRHCGSVLAMSSSLRTLSTAVLHDLHTSVRSLQLTLEQGSGAGASSDVNAVVNNVAAADSGGGGSGGGSSSSSSSNSNNKYHDSNSNEPFAERYDVADDGDARVAVTTSSAATATAATMALLYRVVRAQVAAVLLLQPSVDSRLLLAALREVLDEDDVDAHTRRQPNGQVNGGGSSSLCTATSTDHDVTGLSSCTSDTLHTIIVDSLPAGPLTPSMHQRPTAATPPLPMHDTAPLSSSASSSPQLQPRQRQLLPHDDISNAAASDTAAAVAAVDASHTSRNGNMFTKRIDDTTAVAQAAMQLPQHEQRAQRASVYNKSNNDSDDAMHSNDSTNTLNAQHSCSDSSRNEKELQPRSTASTHHAVSRSLSEQQQQQQPASLLRDGSTSTLATSRNDVNTREPRSGAYILRRSVMASMAASRVRATTTTTAAVDAAKNGAAGEDAVSGAHDSIDDTTLSQQGTEVIDVTGELDRKCASALQSLLQSDDVVVVCNETCSCNAMKLADRFQILRDTQLGTGSFGTVYRAWDELKGSYLAAKEIAIDTRKDRGAAVREVLKEYTILTELSHPNIVRVVAFMVVNNIGRIFMEWMPSGSLQDVLRRSMRGALREAVVSRYVRDVLSGLTYLHSRGILHRDVKPANMLLTVDGNVKLTDFGSSFVFGDNRRTLESVSIMGTAPYMAPEAVQGIYSPATDVWALGCSVVELVTGMTPWSDLITGARMDTIPLIYKIGSLNDTTELDRPHTRLITVKRDGDDGGSNELDNNDVITATTTAAAAAAAAVTTVTVTATAQAQTRATTLTTYTATATTHNEDDDGADVDGANALDGVGASVGNTGSQPYYEEGSHVLSRAIPSTDAAMCIDRSALVHVSTELYDFLQHIFVVDRKQRATSEELLSHAFVRKYNKMWAHDGEG